MFRFAFAETENKEEIERAVKALDSKEIAGRRLRVRSAKDKDKKSTPAPSAPSIAK
jgi:RNA recognition motif-containing protein